MMDITLKSKSLRKELFNYLLNFKYSVRIKKPLLASRIIKDYLQLLLFRKVPLRYVDIALDYACNLRCEHCSTEKLKRPEGTRRMEISDYKNLAKQCHRLGVITVGFTGGEPMLYPHIEQVIKLFRPNKTMISLKTNGVLLNDEWFKKLKSWGVDSISIGLGPVPGDMNDYDKVRGSKLPNVYKKIFDAVLKAKEYRFRVILGVVVSHENIHAENIIRILEKTKEMDVILIFGPAVPAGRWNANRNIILTEEDRRRICELLSKFKHTRTDFESNFMTRGCGAVNEKLYITPFGDVMPCPFLQIKFGNVLEEPLADIRNRGLSYPIFRGYPERCLAADHYGFINDCISLTFEEEKLPIDHNKIKEMIKYDEFGNKVG